MLSGNDELPRLNSDVTTTTNLVVVSSRVLHVLTYRKPPNISPGLIFVRKHFLVGLYMGRLIYGGGGLYTDKILC